MNQPVILQVIKVYDDRMMSRSNNLAKSLAPLAFCLKQLRCCKMCRSGPVNQMSVLDIDTLCVSLPPTKRLQYDWALSETCRLIPHFLFE
jgi:hypothetical protein